MRIFVFLHVLSMFVAVALSGGIDLLMLRIARTRDVPGIRTAFSARHRLGILIPVAFAVGLLFGLIAVFLEGFNPFARWLLLAYVLFVAGIAIGRFLIAEWIDRVRGAALAAPDSGSPELTALIDETRVRYGLVVFWLVIAALVFVMILKPLA